jgi:excisionase family DNA binding protein
MSDPVIGDSNNVVSVSQPSNHTDGSIFWEQPSAPRAAEGPEGVKIERGWLTYREAEFYCGLSRTTLWKLIGAEEVEAARVGRAVRISRESLNAYMRRSTTGSTIAEPE